MSVCLSLDAHAAIQFVQANGTWATPSNSLAVTLTNPPAAGNLIVVAISTYDGDVTGVADTAGNPYTSVFSSAIVSQLGSKLFVYYAAGVRTFAPFTVTVTTGTGGTNDLTIAVHEYAGADALTPLDQSSGAAGSSASPATGHVTTAVDGELYFGATGRDGTTTTDAGVGFDLRQVPHENGGTGVALATEDKVGPSQMTAATFVLASSQNWTCALATFRPAVVDGGTSPSDGGPPSSPAHLPVGCDCSGAGAAELWVVAALAGLCASRQDRRRTRNQFNEAGASAPQPQPTT